MTENKSKHHEAQPELDIDSDTAAGREVELTTDELSENTDETQLPSIGELLKTARKQQGFEIKYVAKQIHLRPSIIQNLEENDFSEITSPTYIKGYIRNYSRFLGLDDSKVQASLAQQLPPSSFPEMQSFSKKTSRQAFEGRLMIATYLILFILLALLVLWWVQKSDSDSFDLSKPSIEEIDERNASISVDPAQQSDGSVKNVETETVELQPLSSISLISPKNAKTESADETGTELGDEVESDTTAEPQIEVQATDIPDSSLSTIDITLTADCWLSIKDANNKTLVSDLKRAGQSLSLTGDAPFKVTLGAPRAVTIAINGQQADLSHLPTGRVAHLTLSD